MLKIGQQLQFYRKKRQLTQKQVAEELHVTPQTISKWELDKSYPDIEQLTQLSKLYKKSITKLIGQEKPSFLDYLADPESFRNVYNIPATKEDDLDD